MSLSFSPLLRWLSSCHTTPSSLCLLTSSRALYFLLLFFIRLAFFLLFASAITATRLWLPFSSSSTFSASRRRAIFWFCERERVAWHLTTMLVGLWIS